MPDAQPPPEQQEAAPPKWFQEYTRDLGGVLQQQSAAIQALGRDRQAAAQARPAPAAPPADPTPFRAQIHDRFLNEPERLFAETIAFAEQRADAKIAQTAQQMRQQMEQERAAERFWGEFYSVNNDLAAFQAEVGTAFAQTDPNLDPSMRANAARDFVRSKLAAVAESAKQGAQRQQQDRRAMAGAPGAGFGGPDRGDGAERQQMSDIERTAKAVAEREKWRRRGNAYDVRSGEEIRQMKADRQRAPRAQAAG